MNSKLGARIDEIVARAQQIRLPVTTRLRLEEAAMLIASPQEAAVVLLERDGRVLAVSRKNDPNAFGLPGGKVDPGETAAEAALRELFEETGIQGRDPRLVYSQMRDGRLVSTFSVTAEIPSALKGASPGETGVVKWVEPSTLIAGPFGDYNKRLFDKVGIPVE